MAFESLARTLRKPFYLKHLLVSVDVLAYIFTPICSVPFLRPLKTRKNPKKLHGFGWMTLTGWN